MTIEILKKRRQFVYENTNRELNELKSKGKRVSNSIKSKIYKKYWKEASKRFKI